MSRPRLLDLFCGIGGASVGYARAGFDVVGVDLAPMPDYPFEFVKADAVTFPLAGFDAVHASPPCAAYTALAKGTNAVRGVEHPRLYEVTAERLRACGLRYVIENPAARPDVRLCGEMFGLGVLRHRNFELGGWSMSQPVHRPHRGRVRGWRHGEYFDGPYVAVYGSGGGKASHDEAAEALRIEWATDTAALYQAIPPAYTEFIGRGLIRVTGTA